MLGAPMPSEAILLHSSAAFDRTPFLYAANEVGIASCAIGSAGTPTATILLCAKSLERRQLFFQS